MEQAQFLAKLAAGSLPVASALQQQVREILLLEQGEGWGLYGKTGWTTAVEPGIGWWVGWIVKQEKIYSFALNMDIDTEADLVKRTDLGRASLKVLKLLP